MSNYQENYYLGNLLGLLNVEFMKNRKKKNFDNYVN